MRDALLMVIVLGLCLLGLVRARLGALGYAWFALVRPDALAWSGANRYSFFLAVCTMLGALPSLPMRIALLVRNPILLGILLMLVPFILSAFFAVNSAISLPALWQFLRALAMAMLIPLLFHDRKGLKLAIMVIGLSIGFIGVKFGLGGLWHGGARYNQGYSGMIADNNALGLALAMSLPLIWFSMHLVEQLWFKVACVASFFLTMTAAVMTYSRGAALSMAAVFLMIVMRSRHKLIILVSMAILVVPIVVFVGGAYTERLQTIMAPSEESSAWSRVVMFQAGLKLLRDFPVLGVGFGRENEQSLIGRYLPEQHIEYEVLVLHNTWLQVAVDSGIFAWLCFVILIFGTIWWLGRCYRRARRQKSGLEGYAAALQVSLIAFAVGATFISRVDFDMYYMLLASAALLYEIDREEQAARMVASMAPAQPVPADPAVQPSQPLPAPGGLNPQPVWNQGSLRLRSRLWRRPAS